jgi:hypothetical protein
MEKRIFRDTGQNVRINNMNAGKGQFRAIHIWPETTHPIPGNDHGIKALTVVQGHGNLVAGLQMVAIQGSKVHVVHNITVHNEQRRIIKHVHGPAQTAARAKDFFLMLKKDMGITSQGRPDLVGQVMAVDHNSFTTGILRHIKENMEQGPVQNREQGLGTKQSVRPEPGAKPGGQDHGLWYLFFLSLHG